MRISGYFMRISGYFMLEIFNISFENGIIPKKWKKIIVLKHFTKRKETEDC